MKASRLPSGNYRVLIYFTGSNNKRSRKSFTSPDKNEALRLAAEYKATHQFNDDTCTFGSVCDAYFADPAIDKTKSPSTLLGYENVYNGLKRRFPSFVETPMVSIGTAEMQAVVDGLIVEGLSPKTIDNYCGFIGAIFRYKRTRKPMCEKPDLKKPRYDIPEKSTIQNMLDKAHDDELELWICLGLAIAGPMRRGEIAALGQTYDEDVDLDKGIIHVRHDLVLGRDHEWHLKKYPKSDASERILLFPQPIIDAIRQQGYVTHWNPKKIYDKFSRFLAREGIKHYRLHDMRHYFASEMHLKKYPDAYIQSRTGHSTMAVLRNVYTHTLTDEKKEMDQKMLNDVSDWKQS